MPLADLPTRREESAPSFLNDQPEELVRYFDDLDILFIRHNVTDQQDCKQAACMYTSIRTEQLWKTTAAWLDQAQTYEDFKTEVLKLYPGMLGSRAHTIQELIWTVERYARIGIESVAMLGEYYCQYLLITRYLIAKGSISTLEQSRGFIQGLQPSLQVRIQEHLQQKFIDHFPDDPYPLSDIFKAAHFVLMGTTSAPLAPHPPLPLHPPAIAAAPTPSPSSIQPDTLNTAITSLAEKLEQALQDQPAGVAATIASTSTPRSICRFCGGAGHFMRTCEVAEDFIQAGKCTRNHDGKIVLPTGALAPHGTPGTVLRDRIEAWHRQNPSHMAVQLFCWIASPPPSGASGQHSASFAATPARCADAPSAVALPKTRSPCQQQSPPLPQFTTQPLPATSLLLAAEAPPPSTTAPLAKKCIAPNESNNPRAVIQELHLDTSSPSSPTRLTSPRYNTPYATASEERFSAARSSVVNATSHNKRDLMSLREDHMCSPSLVSSTTLHVSAQLITQHRHAHNPEGNLYKAMQRAGTCTTIRGHDFHLTLPESQPSAIPLHFPSASNSTQPDQPPTELHPSALTHDSRAEQSPVAAVTEDCISLPEQAAIEPEAALPPSFPIHQPVPLPVATEATPVFVIAAEAIPQFSVAAEASPSLSTVAQQQPALSAFPSLSEHIPFKPFSSLLTSYSRTPNFPRRSLQPPQHRPPSEPPPTNKTARSAATRVTPADPRAPIPFYSPHTRACTNLMLGTAFFFSWEENRGNAQPSECHIRTLATSPSEHHPYTTNSPFRALPRVPHLRAALAMQSRHIPYTDRVPY